jgi:hypothetical protein
VWRATSTARAYAISKTKDFVPLLPASVGPFLGRLDDGTTELDAKDGSGLGWELDPSQRGESYQLSLEADERREESKRQRGGRVRAYGVLSLTLKEVHSVKTKRPDLHVQKSKRQGKRGGAHRAVSFLASFLFIPLWSDRHVSEGQDVP